MTLTNSLLPLRRTRPLICAFILLASALASFAQPHPVFTWTGAGDNLWNNPANWDPAGIPPSNAIAVINSGAPDATALGAAMLYEVDLNGGTLASAGVIMQVLNQNGGTLAGSNVISVGGMWNWTNGWLYGTALVSSGATLNMAGSGDKGLADGAILENQGTINWFGPGQMRAYTSGGSAAVNNRSNAVFNLAGDGSPFTHTYGYQPFDILIAPGAILRKTTGTDNLLENITLRCQGTLQVDTGAVRLNTPFFCTNGTVLRGPGTVQMSQSAQLDGLLTLDGGRFEWTGGTFSMGAGGGVLLSTNGGVWNWSGGTLVGNLTVTNNTTAEFSGSAEKWFADSAELHNYGTITWTGGLLRGYTASGTAILRHHAGARFLARGGTGLVRYYGYQTAYLQIDPGAEFTKTDTGDMASEWQVNNNAVLEVSAGILRLNAGGESSGLFTNQSGATLMFTGGTHLLHNGVHFDGAGGYLVEGTVTLSLDGPVTAGRSGTPGTFELASGTVTGSNFIAQGTFIWSGGTLGGLFTAAPGVVLEIAGSAEKWFADSAELHNFGTITWTGGLLRGYTASGTALLRNHAGARFLANGGTGLVRYYGYQTAYLQFDPGAEFTKTDAGDMASEWQVNNNAVLAVSAGILRLDAGGESSGLFTNQSGATLMFTGGTHLLHNGVHFDGAGGYLVEGTVTLSLDGPVTAGRSGAPGTFELASGFIIGSNFIAQSAFIWSGGVLGGLFTVAPGAVVEIAGPDQKWLLDSAVLEDRGTINRVGLGLITGYTAGGTATLNIRSNAVLNVTTDGTVFSRYYGYQAFNVLVERGGLLRKTTGANTLLGDVVLTLQGELRMDAGVVQWNSPVYLQDGAVLGGPGQVQMTGGSAQLDGLLTLNGANFGWQAGNFSMGAAGGALATRNGAVFEWSAGTLAGTLTLSNGTTTVFSGSGDKLFADSTQLLNYGTITWTEGVLKGWTSGGPATLHNQPSGRFVVAGTGTLARSYGYQPATFLNDGLITLGTPGAQVSGDWVFVQGHTGVLELALAGTNAVTEFGRWTSTAAVTVDGTLRAGLAGGFQPSAGQQFDFLSGGSSSGSFAATQLPPLPAGLTWTVNDTGNTFSLRVEAPGPCAPPPSGLVTWVPGEDTAVDLVSLRQFQLTGGVTFSYGRVGRGFAFDGSGAQVRSAAVALTNVQNTFTLAFWAYPTATRNTTGEGNNGISGTGGQRYAVFPEHGGDDGVKAGVGVSVGNNGVSVFEHAGYYLPSPLVYDTPLAGWTHVAVVYENKTPSLFLNGTLVRTGLTSQRSFVFPSQTFGDVLGYGYYAGRLDEVMIFNRALGSNELTALATAGLTGLCRTNANCIPPPAGLVSWWPGDRDASDLAGTNAGRLINTASLAPGLVGNAFSFDGSSAVVDLGNSPSLHVSAGDFTAAAWVTFNQLGGDQSILDKMTTCAAPNCDGWRLFKQQDGAFWFCLGGGSSNGCDANGPNTLRSATLPQAGAWYHVAAVKRASSFSIYVNGVAEQTKPLPAFTDTDTVDLLLGANGTDGAYLNGMMDEVLLFPRALASNEIAALFAANTAGLCKPGNGSTNQATDFPDLVVAGVTTPDSALMGQSVPIVFTLTNLGRVAAFGPWANQFIIATNAAGLGALALGSATFLGELAAGSSVTVTQSIIVPAGLVGTRFIGVYADAANNISEVNDNNNLTFASTAITITAADLVAGNVSAPATAQFGQTFNVTFAVTNRGTAGASASWNDQIYLSASANSLASPALLVTVPGSPLDAGAIYSRTQAVTLPLVAGLPAGTYFLVILANADNAQLESDAGNNLSSRAITISYAPLPDLVVESVTAPWLVVPGSSVPISWTVTNQGTLAATGGWSEVVVISNVFAGALSLAEFRYTNGLDLGQQLVRTEAVVLPVWLLAGDWQFIVKTDSRFDVFESNEDNNATAATNLSQVPATLTLTLPAPTLPEGAAMLATLTRNGDSTLPLTVTVTNDNPGELDMTNSVVIAAGQASATFAIDALLDGVVDGPQVVNLGATATGYPGATASLTVLDVDIPQLTLVFGAPTVTEGLSVLVTVARDYATNLPLFVAVAGFDPTHLVVPNSVTIPSNQLSYTFAVLAVDDGQIEPPQTRSVAVSAPGYQSAIASVVVLDNDLPNVSLVIARRSVSEGDGPQATVVTITRTPVSASAVTLEVTSSDPGLVLAPAAATIPAGQTSVSFPIGVVDDSLMNGTRNVTLRVFVLDTFGNVIAEGTPDTLQVLDDDGPTLKLALARHLVPQGANPATTAIVTRNTATNTALTVTLASSDTTGITVPASVVIPAGATTASFNLVSQVGGITNGNQSVIVTASAAGFTPGSDVIVVSDLPLPDLVIARVVAPTNGMTDGSFTISYRVENRGLSPSTNPFVTRVSLSTDIFGGGGTLLGEFPFNGTLPVDSFTEQSSQFQWPSAAGQYWVVIVADAANQVPESLENNNTFVSALPINVTAAYTATVRTDVTIAPAGTAVPMSGSAVSADTGLPAPNVPVNVHVVHGGMRRLLAAQTDINGNFTTTFNPLPGEAGLYEIGAAHPSAAVAPVQGSFTLVGLSANPPSLDLTLAELSSITGQITLENLGDSPLTQLSVAILDNPPVLNITAQIGTNGILPASGSVPLAYAITALQSPNRQTGTVRLRVTATNGVSLDIPLNITIEPLRPRLVANPAQLQRSPVRGRQVSVEFEVANQGGAASGPLQISLPPLSWLSLASTNPAPSLAPGQTNRVTLLLNPPADAPLTEYTGNLAINGTNSSLAVPLSFRTISTAVADLRIIAEDEFTYFAQGAPHVTNALVTLSDTVTHTVITNGPGNPQGEFLVSALPEGYYDIQVKADKHESFKQTVLLTADQTNVVRAFISLQLVTYNWTVTPVATEDHYRITIETTFEANVPAPVVTLSPTSLDLGTLEFVHGIAQVNFILQNHGLIAAQAAQLQLPEMDDYEFTALVTNVGLIAANSSIVVPVQIKKKHGIIETLFGPVIAAGNSLVAAFVPPLPPVAAPPPLDQGSLSLTNPSNGSLTNGQAVLYRVDVPSGETLEVALQSAATLGTNDMYVRFGDVPTQDSFDLATSDSMSANVRLVIPTTMAGTYYVLVYARNAPGAPMNYSLAANLLPFGVTRVSTRMLGNSGSATLRVEGARFDSLTRMFLIGNGRTNFPLAFRVLDKATVLMTFDLTGITPGAYDLEALSITNAVIPTADDILFIEQVAADVLLPAYIQVVANQPGALAASVVLPEEVQFGREFPFQVVLTNIGGADVAAPLLRISGKNQVTFTDQTGTSLDDDSESVINILGQIAFNALAPGEEVRVTLYGQVKPGVNASIEVQDLTQMSGPINWSEFEDYYHLLSSADDWESTWQAFTQRAGQTLASFRSALSATVADVAVPSAKAVSADALLFRLMQADPSASHGFFTSSAGGASGSKQMTAPRPKSFSLPIGMDPVKDVDCYRWWLAVNFADNTLRALKVPFTGVAYARLAVAFGPEVADIWLKYLRYDYLFSPVQAGLQEYKDGSQMVDGYSGLFGHKNGFKDSHVTKKAVETVFMKDVSDALLRKFTNCTLNCASLPSKITVAEVFKDEPDHGSNAMARFEKALDYHDDDGIPTMVAGGLSDSFRYRPVWKDGGKILPDSVINLTAKRSGCGNLKLLNLEPELVIYYRDSIDFCPGALAEGCLGSFGNTDLTSGSVLDLIAGGVTETLQHGGGCINLVATTFMQILESHELAYSVPFSVTFKYPKFNSAVGAINFVSKPKRGICPQTCCPAKVGLDYSYLCGGHNVPKQAQGFVNNSKCKEAGVRDCQMTGQGFGGLNPVDNSPLLSGPAGASGGSGAAYSTDAPCTPPSAKSSAVPKSASPKVAGEVCAKVKLRLDQDLVTTRDAFQATLEIVNNTPSALEGIQVLIVVRNQNGEDATDLFGIRAPTLEGVSGVDGKGTVAGDTTGTAGWVLIPTIDAATNGPTQYYVSGSFSYTLNGLSITVPLAPAPITALPSASLVLKYFHQRDVFADDPYTPQIEPSIPYSLAVMIQNNGKGTANNLRITSGQPKIVDNEKGLLINFQIIGTEVAGQSVSPSLTASFGDILPNQIAMARWLFISSLQGLFLDYKATFEHLDAIGNKRLSLIDHVEIHEMIHLVQASGVFEDGRPDFLVNDIPDPDDLPDTLYFSDGTTAPVLAVTTAINDRAPTAGDLAVQLTASMPNGWTYLRVPDPGNGAARLTRVVRSDGVEISFGTNVWTTDRTFIGQGRRPLTENRLHLLDFDSTGSYTLYYTLSPPPDTNAPSSMVLALPANSYPSFPVHWAATDGLDGNAIASFDIYVSIDGAPFDLWLQRTPLNSSVYQGQAGHTYSFYSVAADVAGNREATPLAAEAQTITTLTNTRPTMTLPAAVTLDAGQTLSIAPVAADVDPDQTLTFALLPGAPTGVVLNSFSGQITWATAKANGPSTNQISITVTDNGQPSLSATGTVSVIVLQVNSAPTLAPVVNRRISELQTLTIPLVASDSDLPAQTLTFTLALGAPAGASITPHGGIFTWTPTETQGPSTNQISVIVTDNGSPPLSATQTFTVVVRGLSAGFALSIGTTNLLAGDSSFVPLVLSAFANVTSVSFQLTASSGLLTNLSLFNAVAAIGTANLAPVTSNLYAVSFTSRADSLLGDGQSLAGLAFDTISNGHSAVVHLLPTALSGITGSGLAISNGAATGGRIFIIGREPILDAGLGANGSPLLTLYGLPGHFYAIEARANLNGPGVWSKVGEIDLAGTSGSLAMPSMTGSVFYRASEMPGPALSITRAAGQLLMDWSLGCVNCQLQESTQLGAGANWQLSPIQPQTVNGRYHVQVPDNAGNRFYRLVRP